MPEQPQLLDVPEVPLRVRMKLHDSNGTHAFLTLWVNGDLVNEQALKLRHADVVPLVLRLKPEILIVSREHTVDSLWIKIQHLPVVELI